MKKQIEPQESYSLRSLLNCNAWPWAKSYGTYRAIVERDRRKENILRATVDGDGKGRRITITGRNAIELRDRYQAGTYSLR